MGTTDAQLYGRKLEYGFGLRHIIGLLGFFAVATGYVQRFCLSLAITQMVTYTQMSHKVDPHACPGAPVNATILTVKGDFDWNEETQGLILSAFFWGYVLTQVPGGLLAERFGPKMVLGGGMLLSSLSTMLTPFISIYTGSRGLIALRFILGLGQGPLYPALNVLMSNWAPAAERGRMGAIVFAGAQIGNVMSMALSGLILSWVGWPGVFYVFGTLGFVWVIFWFVVFQNTPFVHPWINEDEKYFITQTSGKTRYEHLPPTPWEQILTSVPLYGLIIAQIGHDWGLFTIITDLPKYMHSVLHFSVKENGLISGMPYLAMWFFALICGWIVDYLIVHRNLNVTFVRKIFISFASVGPAIGIIAASYSGCDKVLTSLFFIFGMGTMGAFIPSLKVNALDLSPNYAGTLMALVGGVGAISGILTPYLVGVLTPNSTLLEWRWVFWISVIVLVFTNAIYLFLGSGEVQWWNDPEELRKYSEEKQASKSSKESTEETKETIERTKV